MARNKQHKQRFSSKHTIADKEKGRQVNTSVKKGNRNVSPAELKKRSKQVAAAHHAKRVQTALQQKRLGSVGGIPKIVGLIPANESGNTEEVLQLLCGSLEYEYKGYQHPFTVSSKEKRASFTFICEKNCNDQDCLDVCKVSDFVILTLDASQSVQQTIQEMQDYRSPDMDETHTIATTWFSDVGLCITDYTRDLITAINSQGAPNILVAIQNLHTFSETQRQKVLKIHQRYFLSVLHDSTKVVSIISQEDIDGAIRHLLVAKPRILKWRDQHPYMAVEECAYNQESREMIIGGHLRGMNLSATQLIHITNHGTFQISKIEDASGAVLEASEVEQRESLQHVQASSTLADEGLPTEADVAFHEANGAPNFLNNNNDNTYENYAPDYPEMMPNEDIIDIDAVSYRTAQTDMDFLRAEDVLRLERMTDEERYAEIEKLREMSEEEAWNPDVVDTPVNLPARQRFAKYRGLKSFATSKWDPTENLPPYYAYIYKLQGYSRIRQAAIDLCDDGIACVGQYIRITLVDVPPSVLNNRGDCLLIASGQLANEQKWSVLHFRVQRCSEFDEPIKSKTPMLAHIGFRKFYVSPLFSEVTAGDRSKFSRFFHEQDKFSVASFFGPISFDPSPILLFQVPSLEEQNEGNPLRLACFGGALPPTQTCCCSNEPC
ncbi:pre-rRNA-processing protein TSR1 [Angomonas deanei]|nr:pre-rRNA-processing protein TSR1 [Angomonas deanei]|eukprot:EPY32536.1 pre-rRNA-processing protein TSR1 [Angomonas deanei]